MNGFGGVLKRGSGRELLEEIIDMRTGDGSGLTGGCRIYGEGECGFKGAEFDGALDLGRHGVAAFGALGYCLRDCFEDAS